LVGCSFGVKQRIRFFEDFSPRAFASDFRIALWLLADWRVFPWLLALLKDGPMMAADFRIGVQERAWGSRGDGNFPPACATGFLTGRSGIGGSSHPLS